jgi:mannose-6-phosphate isomerase-like protein (cupin superfamily)
MGPPDQMNVHLMRWLLIPGPPMSCTLVHHFASPIPVSERKIPYHMHPDTWSIHVCISGKGKHFAEGHVSDVLPGTVFYEAPKVPHALVSEQGHELVQVCIQYPGAGYEEETKIVPEAGTLERYGDLAAFLEKFGTSEPKQSPALFKSDRWLKYITGRGR